MDVLDGILKRARQSMVRLGLSEEAETETDNLGKTPWKKDIGDEGDAIYFPTEEAMNEGDYSDARYWGPTVHVEGEIPRQPLSNIDSSTTTAEMFRSPGVSPVLNKAAGVANYKKNLVSKSSNMDIYRFQNFSLKPKPLNQKSMLGYGGSGSYKV